MNLPLAFIQTPSASSYAKSVPTEIVLLLLILGLLIFMWDLFERKRSSLQKDTGFDEKTEVISVKGSSVLPAKTYVSATLGISGKPDALIREDNFLIPVDIKPTTNKVRDRHVAPLMLHMKLIEEVEGKRPPYGVLLMGPKRRLVRIKNSEEKQRWISALLDEMRSIMNGIPAVPAPARFKCKYCDVRSVCKHNAAD